LLQFFWEVREQLGRFKFSQAVDCVMAPPLEMSRFEERHQHPDAFSRDHRILPLFPLLKDLRS
jgi:hypothetical protein